MLRAAGWAVQDKNRIDHNEAKGIAVREYQTDVGPVDYALFVDRKAVGVIEAKPEDWGHKITTVEEQSGGYASAQLKWVNNSEPLPFVYESTGEITRFTNGRDPKPRSREVFSFHQPETLLAWFNEEKSFRARLQDLPELNTKGLRDCQISAITNLEESFKADKPRALIQLATGAGKTFTAITSSYRLLKHAKAKRILFLVDTKNLGEQAEGEFIAFEPNDDNRKFSELYNARRLTSSYVPADAEVSICTIQRMYSILKGEPLDETAEIENPAESLLKTKEPLPVEYNAKVPPEFYDVIIIDECHRSIYNLWRQVLEYFDSYLVGLTATPDNRTFGFFKKNVVSEYTHEDAVIDSVNVQGEVFLIETEVTQNGVTVKAGQDVERRERLTRRKRWEQADEDTTYTAKQLDKSVVNPDQIRTVIKEFKNQLPNIFPGRTETPKTLIFAKTDSHADDIIQTVREEFGEGNEFCKKVTYQAEEDPKSVLAQFRNNYYPRIAVTVDMIATGTDVKPLECLLFMRDVKSKNYFEQMKGRGTRTLDAEKLKLVTPSANGAKTHYVLVDAVGVTKSIKTTSPPLDTKPTVPMKDLATALMMGVRDEEAVSSLAGRLARLDRQITKQEHERIKKVTGGISVQNMVQQLLNAVDPDTIEQKARVIDPVPPDEEPKPEAVAKAKDELIGDATKFLTGEVVELLDTIRRDHEQTIDHETLDRVTKVGWQGDADENAKALRTDFESYLAEHKDEIDALTIFYSQRARRSTITYEMIRELMEKLKSDKPKLAPLNVWRAYAHLDEYRGDNPVSELTALVALIRRVTGIDETLSPFSDTVRRNFQNWVMKRHAGAGEKFNEEQMSWLHMIREHISTSHHLDRDDLENTPFDAQGGMGKMYQLFGDEMDSVISELNEVLTG